MKFAKLILLPILAVTLFAYTGIEKKKKKNKKPNIIVVLVDDLGYGDVSFNGSKDIPTPHIDRIANEGAKFTNGYVTYAVCGPSRAALVTGRYQDRYGSSRNPLWAPNDITQGLSIEEETIADFLGREGYKSMALGKWHLGGHKALRPLKRGFDEFYGFLTGGHRYFPEDWTLSDISQVKTQQDAYRTKLLHNDTRVDEKEYLTDALSREAVKFIENNSDEPFFMYLAYNAPHAPFQATQKYLDRFPNMEDGKRKTYCAMVSAVDDGVGRVLKALEDQKIDDNTLVVFLSDNGGKKGKMTDQGPLRGYKGSIYEGGFRVPFAMRWPTQIKAGTVYNEPIIAMDIAAIAAEFANATPKNKLDGVNLIPYLNGEKSGAPHESIAWRKFDQKRYAVRKGDLKMIVEYNPKKQKETTSYYNVKEDISEKEKLQLTKKQRDDLKLEYKNWLDQMIDPTYMGLLMDKEYSEKHPDRFETEIY